MRAPHSKEIRMGYHQLSVLPRLNLTTGSVGAVSSLNQSFDWL